MLKKCLALLVCLTILIGIIPLGAKAQSESQRVREDILRIYNKVRRATGRWDLSGFCGTMVAYQLYYLGVNTAPLVYDGRDQFEAYKDLEYSSGGNPIKAYSAKNYTLREALYAITNGGTKDVYNVLIGFQWTDSEAGRRFGHAVVVNAILDGVMYFSESFDTSHDKGEGTPCVCSIDAFVKDYSRWSGFDGLILFGQKDKEDFCQEYSCNAFLQAKADTPARDVPGTQQSVELRTVKRGERLEAIGLYENENMELYYKIVDSGNIAYVNAEDVRLVSLRYDDVKLLGATYPQILRPGENFKINGTLRSTHNEVHNVMVRILDELGREVDCFPIPVEGRYKELKNTALRYEIDFSHLTYGNYTLEITAEVRNHYLMGNRMITENQKCTLAEVPFAVGYSVVPATAAVEPKTVKNGWLYEEGLWRYYENDVFRTGWFCSGGVDYYLLEDGAAATGWQEINGKMRFFSDTGAMRTGWLDDNGAVYYLLSNGVPVTGERTIDGVAHTFGTDGILVDPVFLNH